MNVSSTGGFHRTRGSALAYLEGHARNARRDVCQEHAPPGMRRRPGTDANGIPVPWLPAVPMGTAAITIGIDADPGRRATGADPVEDMGFEEALDRIVVEQLEHDASVFYPLVADLLVRMRHGSGLGEAAAELGVSRHAARRALDQFGLILAA